jgi:hypothetical protein
VLLGLCKAEEMEEGGTLAELQPEVVDQLQHCHLQALHQTAKKTVLWIRIYRTESVFARIGKFLPDQDPELKVMYIWNWTFVTKISKKIFCNFIR